MREVKFKVYINEGGINKGLFEVADIDFYNKKIAYLLTDDFGDGYLAAKCDFKYATLLQYTGLKDINGKEIYAGDIVYIHYIDKKKIAKVELDLAWGVSLICDEEINEDKIKERVYERVEVICNIYENSELLEDLKDVKNN